MVVGSEAEGPRAEARATAHALVSVPMPGGAESLNVAVAGGIVMYMLTRAGPAAGRSASGASP